jgi:hypothetical protein
MGLVGGSCWDVIRRVKGGHATCLCQPEPACSVARSRQANRSERQPPSKSRIHSPRVPKSLRFVPKSLTSDPEDSPKPPGNSHVSVSKLLKTKRNSGLKGIEGFLRKSDISKKSSAGRWLRKGTTTCFSTA